MMHHEVFLATGGSADDALPMLQVRINETTGPEKHHLVRGTSYL